MSLVRREFLHLAGAAIAAPAVSRIAWAQAPAAGQPLAGKGLIVGRQVPLTAEAPLEGITTWITPNDRFPILTSIAQTYPAIEANDWQLTI